MPALLHLLARFVANLSNLDDYLCDPNIPRAYNAAATTSFLADVMWAFYGRNDKSKIAKWPSFLAFLTDLVDLLSANSRFGKCLPSSLFERHEL
jgi:hypothetical protein